MRTVSILSLVLLLAGCANDLQRSGPAAPVEQPGGVAGAKTTEDGGVVISAYEPPPPVEIAEPRPARAVEVLAMRAEDQRQAGQLTEAAASIERALRIAPRDAGLWHRLAQVRNDQRRYGEAVELATKSNSLARSDRLRRDNWRLIAGARRAQGDVRGARAAEQRAASLR